MDDPGQDLAKPLTASMSEVTELEVTEASQLSQTEVHTMKPDATEGCSICTSTTNTDEDCDCKVLPLEDTTTGDCDCTEEELESHEIKPRRSSGFSKKGVFKSINPYEKKPKLRTSKDVYDRLKWDGGSINTKINARVSGDNNSEVDLANEQDPIDISGVYIGYKDRFLGMCELPYEEFDPTNGDIPYHRIYYFRTGGPPLDPFVGNDGEVKVREDNWPPGAVFLWDRESRTDLVFKSGNCNKDK